MQDTETPTEAAVTSTGEPIAPNECSQCHKVFSNPQGLRMHIARVHSKTLGDGFNWKGRPRQSHEVKLAKRREYNRKWRLARGIKPRKENWREARLRRLNEQAAFGSPKGQRWTAEQRIKFQNTLRKKTREKTKRLQYVYPTPEPEQTVVKQPTNIRKVRYCPFCGEFIEKHLYETP